MKTLRFGTAGIPLSTVPHNTVEGVKHVRTLGLEAMEMEFVHSVNIKPEKAPAVKAAAKKADVVLTCHAPYYINLNAKEPEKRKASIGRILNSARILSLCGGWSVCFHPGYYLGMPHDLAYTKVRDAIEAVVETVKEEDLGVWIRPEIGGKTTSWGSLEEIIKVCQEVDQVLPCIDWAHLYARSLGKKNSYEDFRHILDTLEKELGKQALKNMHCHVEGIEYGKTGERNHVVLEDSEFNYQDLIAAFKDYSLAGVIICESPNIEEDAKTLQKAFLSK